MAHHEKDMGGIMVLFLILIVGLALTPTVTEMVLDVTNSSGADANVTGAALAIMRLVPLFWVILVVAVVLGGVIVWLKT